MHDDALTRSHDVGDAETRPRVGDTADSGTAAGTTMTATALLETSGRAAGVYCVRACIGYVSGHIRGTRGVRAEFTHPRSQVTWVVFRCGNCGAHWKVKKETVDGARGRS